MIWMFLDNLLTNQEGTVKCDLQDVVTLAFEALRYVDSFWDEHILRFKYLVAIEPHCSVCIETIKCQNGFRSIYLGKGEGSPINPSLLANPLNVIFILAYEGVGYNFVVNQIKMHVGWKLGDGQVT